MKIFRPISISCLLVFALSSFDGFAQPKNTNYTPLKQVFLHPPQSARPWVYWYWMRSSVTKAGITADLEAMHNEGIGGAYLMTIRETANPPFINPPVVPLTPEWWAMVRFTIAEAKRLGIQLAMTPCDGWALAGGPWITPQLSMQKIVWTKTEVTEGLFNDTLARPESYKGYYKDIAVYAYPAPPGYGINTYTVKPIITTSVPGENATFLLKPGNKKNFQCADSCWIQLAFDKPFTCRSLIINPHGHNYQAQRMIVETSNDGKNFKYVTRLEPPRHGWQNSDEDNTHTIPATTARYFRLIYSKAGSEPGAEDLDFAKWKPELDITGIQLSSEAKIHQFEGKNGSVWRVSRRSTNQQLPADVCIPKNKLLNITNKLDASGHLKWQVPPGKWIILRMGHTSTGHENAAAGKAGGLECDKFSVEAAKIQFNGWFGEVIKQNGPEITKDILKIFHVDSWECGSQNWSPDFSSEFKKRRGYDLLDYLPVMAGVPVISADVSERVLNDVRHTITELTTDNFFGTMQKLAHEKGCTFSAEAVAPTMVSDDLLHFSRVDIPMGEFWYRSPTHDKPNDIFDAISGGHIYGKNIIQAESFTELRLMWDEHPAMLKTMTDRNLALGINRFVLHVNTHNPWTNRKPGMTLDGVGLFFQHDQTWYKPGKAWIDYIQSCQALLQQGKPVVDIAVFTGEEVPGRALLPDRLVNTLPGIFGKERIQQEKIRLANKNVPLRTVAGDVSVANFADPENWIDPLRGYNYDCINKDALIRLAAVHNGRIELPDGASYAVLVVPGARPMSPDAGLISPEVLKKLQQLANDGATIVMNNKPVKPVGMATEPDLQVMGNKLFTQKPAKGRILTGPYQQSTFDALGLQRDFFALEHNNNQAKDIAWIHRTAPDFDLYFIANQQNKARDINISLRSVGHAPEIWDALTRETRTAGNWQFKAGRTTLPIRLEANGSLFIILQKNTAITSLANSKNSPAVTPLKNLNGPWQVSFDAEYGGPRAPVTFNVLYDWTTSHNKAIKYYSGTAVYRQNFDWQQKGQKEVWLAIGDVKNLAQVYINGINCGVAWTYPYRVNISKALKQGKNELKIEVTNTWANRLTGDQALPEKDRITWTNAPYRLDNKLLPAGLLGTVKLVSLDY